MTTDAIIMTGRMNMYSRISSGNDGNTKTDTVMSFGSVIKQSIQLNEGTMNERQQLFSRKTDNPASMQTVRNENLNEPPGSKAAVNQNEQNEDTNQSAQMQNEEDNIQAVFFNGLIPDEMSGTNIITDISDSDVKMYTDIADSLMELQKLAASILGIGEDELKKMMENLNISITQLVSPQTMTQLVLKANNAEDMSTVLMNDNMCEQLTRLISAAEHMLGENNMSREELNSIMQSGRFAEFMQTIEENTGKASDIQEMNTDISEENNKEAIRDIEVSVIKKNETGENNNNTSRDSSEIADESKNLSGKTADSDKITMTESFINGMENALKAREVKLTDIRMGLTDTIRDIVFQLAEQIKVVISPSQTSLEMQLNPESLGKVSLNISSKDGVMTAQITAQNQVTKEAIESQIQILRENIESQGLKVDAIEVTVSDFSFSQSKDTEGESQEQSHKNSNGVRQVRESRQQEISEEEKLNQNVMLGNGNTVDLIA